MATTTYEPIETYTVSGSSTTQVIFGTGGTVPQTYTDLIIVANMKNNTGANYNLQMQVGNGTVDTTNYSSTYLGGSGSGSGYSGRDTALGGFRCGLTSNSTNTPVIIQLQNYSNTTTFKTALSRGSDAGGNVIAVTGTWRSTSAINIIRLYNESSAVFGAGSTFTLYGIANADIGAKATGGVITYDSTYYYHTFGSSGTFTPKQSLTCDYLIVAGGGGGGGGYGAGAGGGGGYRYFTGGSFTATGYTVTVGAGGTGGAAIVNGNGTKGGDSTFNSLTATGGGLGGGDANTGGSGGSGGGGGGNNNVSGGAGNTPSTTPSQGNAGGSTVTAATTYGGGGGGGISSAGGNGAAGVGGTGGNGTANSISGLSVTYSSGGGGGAETSTTGNRGIGGTNAGNGGVNGVLATSGVVNTGSGGGGGGGLSRATGGNGGSGVVVIRYTKA